MDATGYFRPQTHTFVLLGWHGDGVEDEQLLRQSSFDIVAVFGDNVAGFGDNVAAFGDNVAVFDIVAGVDGALSCFSFSLVVTYTLLVLCPQSNAKLCFPSLLVS